MNTRRTGFTLVELLMVVLVILMLSAMLFRGAALVGDRVLRAKAISDIQNLQNALNEYLAEYGTYPPVQKVAYILEHRGYQPPVFRRAIIDPERPLSDTELGYDYGLVAHLWPRHQPDHAEQVIPYDEDTQRDIDAKQRWANYLSNISLAGDADPRINTDYDSVQAYSNAILTIKDPWGQEYLYRSPPPHLSYRLWSAGPDGASGMDDDISNATL